MTHFYTRHESCMSETHIEMSHVKRTWLTSTYVSKADMTHFYMRHDSFLYETRVMYEWDSYTNERREADRTHISMSHVSSICMSHISVSAICMSYPQSVCPLRTSACLSSVSQTWLTSTCVSEADMTHFYMRHDSHLSHVSYRNESCPLLRRMSMWVMFWCRQDAKYVRYLYVTHICIHYLYVTHICIHYLYLISAICIAICMSYLLIQGGEDS